MRKKNIISENYLENKPYRNENFRWTADEKGMVTLEVDNKGIFNRIAQKLLKKPSITFVHLDENGSFVWQTLDGEKTIVEIGVLVKEKFGEKAEPLYERLAKYFQILESYGFVGFNK